MSEIIASNINSNSGLRKKPSAGVWVKISAVSASSSATVSFTSGLDSTYDKYCFIFNNIHAATDNQLFHFNGSSDTGSNYNVTKTTTFWRAYHAEDDSSGIGYDTGGDLAQGTGFQVLNGDGLGIDNDQSTSGYLYLYNPADTTFVKHFISTAQGIYNSAYSWNMFIAGYFNTTSAIDEIQFKMSADEIDSGKIKLYGLKDSA